MRLLVQFAGLMAIGLAVAVLGLGFATGFDAASGKAMASGATGLDLKAYTAGLAVGIVVTYVVRFGLAGLVRRFAYWAIAVTPGLKLTALGLICGAILLFY
jgi:hypothetical protein